MMSSMSSHLPRLLWNCHFNSYHLSSPCCTVHGVLENRLCVKSKHFSHSTINSSKHQLHSSFSHVALNINKVINYPFFTISRDFRSLERKSPSRIKTLHVKQCRHINTEGDVCVRKGCFEGVKDRFNGVWVDLSQSASVNSLETMTDKVFDDLLSNSLAMWKSENVSSVWLKVPINMSHVISVASQHQFEYHHAEGKMAVLCLWMNGSTESRIPRFATHQIGVSGVVVDETNREVLVVKDKNKNYNVWKFPGGLSDLGEDIADTAVREVFEETGVRTEFKSILAFRQTHDLRNAFGRSDIYILCRLKPLSFEVQPCAEEIEAAQWMPIDDLMRHPETSAFSRHMTGLVVRGLDHGFHHVDITPNQTQSVFKTNMQLFHRSLRENETEDSSTSGLSKQNGEE